MQKMNSGYETSPLTSSFLSKNSTVGNSRLRLIFVSLRADALTDFTLVFSSDGDQLFLFYAAIMW